MTQTISSGLVDDLDVLSNERVIEMDPVISMLDPDSSQFITMLMRVARGTVESTKAEWLEDELFPRLSSVAVAGYLSGATSIPVATGEGTYFRVGDVFRNARTGVAQRVTSISTDTLTCTAPLGRVSAAAGTSGDQLLIVGNASAQGATLGTRKVTKRVAQYNYQVADRELAFSA